MGYTTDLLTGLSADLHLAGIGTWRDTGLYQPGETGITHFYFPDQPDRVICLSTYGVDDAAVEGDDTIGMQVRTRWEGQDPTGSNDLADLVFEHWHSAHDLHLVPAEQGMPGLFVKQILRRSTVSGGMDANHRWSVIQNFYLTVPRTTPHRP